MDASQLVLGVDGGGTKTVAWLAPQESPTRRSVVGRGSSGPTNLSHNEYESVATHLDNAIESAFADAGISRAPVAGACLGLAGCGQEHNKTIVERWAAKRDLATQIRVVHDAFLVLFAGSDDGTGIALISGTGSIAFARNSFGKTTRHGGGGFIWGDEGSGVSIAGLGLNRAVRMLDGSGPDTVLLDKILSHFELTEPSELHGFIRHQLKRETMAEFAPMVFEACNEGDLVANRVVNEAAVELAQMVVQTIKKLNLAPPHQLFMSGGVLCNQDLLQQLVCDELQQMGVESTWQLVPDPVLGALRLAADLA